MSRRTVPPDDFNYYVFVFQSFKHPIGTTITPSFLI